MSHAACLQAQPLGRWPVQQRVQQDVLNVRNRDGVAGRHQLGLHACRRRGILLRPGLARHATQLAGRRAPRTSVSTSSGRASADASVCVDVCSVRRLGGACDGCFGAMDRSSHLWACTLAGTGMRHASVCFRVLRAARRLAHAVSVAQALSRSGTSVAVVAHSRARSHAAPQRCVCADAHGHRRRGVRCWSACRPAEGRLSVCLEATRRAFPRRASGRRAVAVSPADHARPGGASEADPDCVGAVGRCVSLFVLFVKLGAARRVSQQRAGVAAVRRVRCTLRGMFAHTATAAPVALTRRCAAPTRTPATAPPAQPRVPWPPRGWCRRRRWTTRRCC